MKTALLLFRNLYCCSLRKVLGIRNNENVMLYVCIHACTVCERLAMNGTRKFFYLSI